MNKVLNGYKLIIYYLSVFAILIGTIILIPCSMFIFYKEEIEYAYCFVIPGVVSILFGYLISSSFKGFKKKNLEKYQDAILVVSIWILAIIISAIPFMLTGKYNFTQSVFEVTSGYSTTGLSVVDVTSCPHVFLFYRSILLFVGGVGFVLILTSAISDKYSLRLYNREGHTDKLLPNLAKSARLIFTIYASYILIGTVCYVICGMELFDALNHSIAAISTGGFSTKQNSIYEYNSVGIEIITIILMLLGSTNFVVHMMLIKRKFKGFFKHCETKFLFICLVIFLPIMIINLLSFDFSDIPTSIRTSVFMFVSSITTTGFQNVESIKSLPCTFLSIMILLMLVGGSSGSTAGGIKQYRIVVVLKGLWYSIKDQMSSKKVVKTKYISKVSELEQLDNEEIHSNLCFVILYLCIFITGSLIFTMFGYSFSDSMFEFASSLSTVGLSVGITSYSASPVILWTSTIGMLLGRLELYVVFQAFIRLIQDIRRKEVI